MQWRRLTRWSPVVLGLALPGVVQAQARVPEQRLDKPDTEFPESFDQVSALRELPGGKVLLVDLGPKSLIMADFKAGTQSTIGRNGQGPGEYQFPGGLVSYPGDTTLLVDLASRRFLAVSADGRIGKTIPYPETLQGLAQPKGADRQGRIYLQASPFNLGDGVDASVIPDSAPIVRWDRSNNRIDTLGKVKIPATKVQRSGTSNARVIMMRPQPYAPQDEWVAAPDGRVGVARVGDYHVEWFGDRPAKGAPVPYQHVKVTDGDKQAFMDAMKNSRNRITVNTGGRGPAQELKPPEPSADEFDWPAEKPAFRSRGAFLSPEGEMWLLRSNVARDSVPVFDVFNGSGTLARRVILPKGRQLVGIGQGTVYAVRTDADGLQWLERYKR